MVARGCYRDSEEFTMAQQLRASTQTSLDGSRDWLAGLVAAADSIEQLSQVPCDASALRAMRARLSRPTSTHAIGYRFERTAQRYSPASCSRGS